MLVGSRNIAHSRCLSNMVNESGSRIGTWFIPSDSYALGILPQGTLVLASNRLSSQSPQLVIPSLAQSSRKPRMDRRRTAASTLKWSPSYSIRGIYNIVAAPRATCRRKHPVGSGVLENRRITQRRKQGTAASNTLPRPCRLAWQGRCEDLFRAPTTGAYMRGTKRFIVRGPQGR